MDEQRTVLVTGASRGIGLAICRAFPRPAYRVIAAARDTARLIRIVEDGYADAYLSLDLADPAALPDAGDVDILVNNAGIAMDGLAVRMKPDVWESVLRVNLTGAFRCCQAVLPSMLKRRWGRIVNVSSVVGEMGNAGQANYAAAKAGLIGLTKALAAEVGSRGITVNAVAPGFIETDMTAGLGEEVRRKMLAGIPLGRFGAPEDVAAAVRFLAGEDAGYITGAVLKVNGGMYR